MLLPHLFLFGFGNSANRLGLKSKSAYIQKNNEHNREEGSHKWNESSYKLEEMVYQEFEP